MKRLLLILIILPILTQAQTYTGDKFNARVSMKSPIYFKGVDTLVSKLDTATAYRNGSLSKWTYNRIITSGIGGSGTTNRIPYFTNSTTLGNSPLTVSTNDVSCTGKLEGSNVETNETTQTTRLGIDAGKNENESTYRYNTYLGYWAGYTGTTASNNVFIGLSSGYYNTGSSNTFIGTQSGLNNSSGSNNVFIGLTSGQTNTTGSNNIFIGYNSGSYTAKSNRICIGSVATTTAAEDSTKNIIWGYQHATATNQRLDINARLGAHNMETNATSYTTRLGIGTSNSENETAERWNAFIGSYAGYTTSTGTYNTFLGTNSGYSNSTGSYNLCLGNAAGKNNSTLSKRLFISSIDYNNLGEDTTKSIIYGYQHGTTANQRLYVNADFVNEAPHVALYRNTDLTISATQNVWYKVTGFTAKDAGKVTVTGDSVQLTKKGHYLINFTTSFSGANNEIWEIAVFKNNVMEEPSQLRYTSTSDVGNAGCPVYLSSDGDDWVSFKIRNTTDNDDPTIKRFSGIISTIHLQP